MKALSHHNKQKGAVLVLVTVALFVLLGFTALALDGGYLLLNKTRVQDAVDSAALSGAKTLDSGGTHDEATLAVYDTLATVLSGEGFSSVDIDTTDLETSVIVEFSETVYPDFVATTDEAARYIRVTLDTVPVTQFFSQLLLDTWQVGASAVAGASPPIENPCQIIPLLMCAGDLANKDSPNYSFGFNPSSTEQRGDILVIKAPNHNKNSAIGPGNFLALDLGEVGGGAEEFREGLAGNVHDGQCGVLLENGELRTKTGNMIGPTEAGLNTRFGEYNSPMTEPLSAPVEGGADAYYADCAVPDYSAGTALELVNFNGSEFDNPDGTSSVLPSTSPLANKLQGYNDYYNNVHSKAPGTQHCIPKRRQVSVPVADCTGHNPGSTDLELIGFACMFLTQKVTGSTGNTQFIVAEFVENCTSEGGGFSDHTNGLDRLVLYKDPDGKGA